MYYYIFEQPKSNAARNLQEKIKETLVDYGILGELNTASPARPLEELTRVGLEKESSTIVAVGSDYHISQVASAIKSFFLKNYRKEVALGAVPTDENSNLAERLGFESWKTACEALKYRRLQEYDLGYLEPAGIHFLTSAEIHSQTPVSVALQVDRWETTTWITDLIVFNDLTLTFHNRESARGLGQKIVDWLFARPIPVNQISIFKTKIIEIRCSEPLPITIEGVPVAKTPVSFYRRPKALKIIVKRDKLSAEESE